MATEVQALDTQGKDGVGIEKIEQTLEGLYDGRPNVFTIYLTNGDKHEFKVLNGSQGVGIEKIVQTASSTVSGGRNEYSIVLTNGKEYPFSVYNGSGGTGGDNASFNQVLRELNNLIMPSEKCFLYYSGSQFQWKPLGDSDTPSSDVDLTQYSWWGRTFDTSEDVPKKIIGEMSSVTSIEFLSSKDDDIFKKKLYLDENGDLCFDGNFYTTGGITALGSGGGTSGGTGGGGSTTGTLYFGTSNNNLGFNGSKDMSIAFGDGLSVEKTDNQITVSATGGGSGGSGITIKRNGTTVNATSGSAMSCTSINFAYPSTWTDSPISRTSNNEVKIDLSVVAANASGGTGTTLSAVMSAMNDQLGKTTLNTPQFLYWNGSTYTWKNESAISGGTTSNRLYFTQGSSQESWNGSSTFNVVFGTGITANFSNHNTVTISANGTSVDLSGYATQTWVKNQGYLTSHQSLSDYLTKSAASSTYLGINATAVAATKLATARTIWGQSFNGTANISGDMSNVGNITFSSQSPSIKWNGSNTQISDGYMELYQDTPYIDFHYNRSTANYTSRFIADGDNQVTYRSNSGAGIFRIEDSGFLKIGNGTLSWDSSNSCFKIDGSIYATGGITALGVSNSSTTSNNVDFTFNSVTANKFIVKNAIWLSESLYLQRDETDFDLCSNDGDEHCFYLNGNAEDYYLSSEGNAYFNSLDCDMLSFGSITNFNIKINNASTGDFSIVFRYNGKTYTYTPSSNASVS